MTMRPNAVQILAGLLLVLAFAGCAAPGESASFALQVSALAGPTCPVVSDPPDPDCADGPVEGAEIAVQDGDGVEVARMTTDGDGAAEVELAPGRYVLVPQPVDGLMGTAQPIAVTLVHGIDAEPVTIAYDTGIR